MSFSGLTTKGFQEFEATLKRLDTNTAEKLGESSITSASKIIRTDMKQRIARFSLTGTLSDSIKLRKAPKKRFEVAKQIGVFAPHAHLIEFGTKAHSIKPIGASKALSFRAGGRAVVVKEVEHPGTAARPFIRPALDSKTDAYFAKLGKEVQKRIFSEIRRT